MARKRSERSYDPNKKFVGNPEDASTPETWVDPFERAERILRESKALKAEILEEAYRLGSDVTRDELLSLPRFRENPGVAKAIDELVDSGNLRFSG